MIKFHPTKLKTDRSIKFKLQGKRFIPEQSIKYLPLEQHFQMNNHNGPNNYPIMLK